MSAFNDQGFEKKLLALKDSQESISTLSDWCLQNRQHHKKIVATWLSVLKKVRVENRLTLFYLANDVVQYSKRKNYDFVESWGTALQKATTMVRHDKVMDRILRIFKIWGERNVYSEEFLTDLRGLLTVKKATPATPQTKQAEQQAPSVSTVSGEFVPVNLFVRMSKCKDLEDDTDLKLKVINECKLKLNDLDAFRNSFKDRRHADGVAGELDDAISQMEGYKKALEVEVLERKAVIELLQQAAKFYENEKSDAKVVFNAYRNFGSRVKSLKRKLDELIPTLSSPIPSPDVNAPSPSPDSDIDLPNDEDLTGIVECLEDLSDAAVVSDSEDDLMSIISYRSSDDEYGTFSRYDWQRMSGSLRRQYLPLPKPEFSDSDLTELDDSLEEVDETSCVQSENFSKLPSTQICSKISVNDRINSQDCINSKALSNRGNASSVNVKVYEVSTKLPSLVETSAKSCRALSSTQVVFKEPEHRKISYVSHVKNVRNIANQDCPVTSGTASLTKRSDSSVCGDVQAANSFPKAVQEEGLWINTENSCVSKDTFYDVETDLLPSDEDLSGLLECLQDGLIDSTAEKHSGGGSPLSEEQTR